MPSLPVTGRPGSRHLQDRQRGDFLIRLSIVIPNYNYARYLGEAVSSALAVDWPEVEIIVVDDGSTDDSMAVLAVFGNRITVIQQENSGPRTACNRGFDASSGDVVIFLDSDDVLEPSIAREVATVWRSGVSKVQVQMWRIDQHGRPRGGPFPRYGFTPTPQQIREWMTVTSAYPTPPGSGNLYSRAFLDRLFPLDDRCGDATDSACLAAAPFLGDVLTVPKPLVQYRIHGENRSALRADPRRFTRQIERACQRDLFAREVAGCGLGDQRSLHLRALRRGRHLLQMRVAERRIFAGEPPIPGDSRARMIGDSIVNIFSPGSEPVVHRLAMSMWCLVTLVAPVRVAKRLIHWRFA